jgi:uridine kinase
MQEIHTGDGARAFAIGVAGGTGSGKTTVSRRIWEAVGRERIAYLPARQLL